MGLSEIPPPPEARPGNDLPDLRTRPPGPQSRTWLTRLALRQAPMGPAAQERAERGVKAKVASGSIVLSHGKGSNLLDVDSNRYVDLAAGFGAMLLGHGHEAVLRALEMQGPRLMQALGDVYPSDAKIGLLERLARLHWDPSAQCILGQSGADAVTAALKTATLATNKPGVIAFSSSYHGLSHGPLAVTDLREGYRAPFAEQLAQDVTFCPYPAEPEQLDLSLSAVSTRLRQGTIGAVIVEPILGRGGVIVPPAGFLSELRALSRAAGAMLIADEIWTGLGRAGAWLIGSEAEGFEPDLICLGKGLGGGVPISACVGSAEVMSHWQRPEEVVHTATFAGAPLACTAALATLDVLGRHQLIERSRSVGEAWRERLAERLTGHGVRAVRGRGLMLGLELDDLPGGGPALQRALLERGYVTSTGGGQRDTLVLTPPLNIAEDLLESFDDTLVFALSTLGFRPKIG